MLEMTDCFVGYSLLLLFNCFNTGITCEPRNRYGWFGSKWQYKCHCVNSCGADGECKGGCASGWFGAKCQYQDLITFAQGKITSENEEVSELQDNNDKTCSDKKTIKVDFKTDYYFSWLRAVVEYSHSTRPSILLQDNANKVIQCTVNKVIVVDNIYMDIQCFASTPVRYLIMQTEGVKLCTLWVSGGKNVALMQTASQSSTFTSSELSHACNAVDGNTNGQYIGRSCSHTDQDDPNPNWELSFTNPSLVNRIVLYNRIEASRRLQQFNVDVLYTTTLWSSHPLYDSRNITIFTTPNQMVTFLRVSLNPSALIHNEKYLTLCEVEVYSECPQESWGLECDKTCDQKCDKSCRQDDGLCTNNCIGFRNPPLCSIACRSGFYGRNCSEKCSTFCKSQVCDSRNGLCKSCITGYKGGYCNEECPKGTWGDKCSNNCSLNCITNNECDNIKGKCQNGCKPGFQPPNCEKSCSKGTHGSQCSQNCSNNCLHNDCNTVSGICFNCTSGYLGKYCEQSSLSTSGHSTVIVITLVILTLLIVVAVVVLIWRFRKRDTSHFKLLPFSKKSVTSCNKYIEDDMELDLRITEIKSESPVVKISDITSVSVNVIQAYLTSKGREFFFQQFKSVIQPKNVTTEAALSDENRGKNRYKNISPYDHSRVCLKINIDSKEGDYINASYIKNYKGEIKFIASQGPNKVMIDDFIRMLWEQRTDVIAMLTRTVENGKIKCEQYWPEKGTLHFGKIKVKLLYTETFADFSIRKLELIKKDEISHSVTQLHFHSWPDQNVPSSPWGLLEFNHKVSSIQTSKPIVVHCSAGVGRTGTFIGLCDLIDQARETGCVDFFDTLVRLRQDRMWMIQTAEQYIFLHKAVLVSSLYLGTYNEANEFYEKAGELGQKTSSGKTKLEEEYQNICSTSAYLESDSNNVAESESEETKNVYENSASVKTSRKNRFSNILPKSDYRVFLASEPKDSGTYINAVFVQNFRHKDQHILTQLPMPQTLVDFWRMVTEYKVSLVVSFESDTSATDESVAEYLPSNEDQVIMCTPFKISSAYRKETDLWEERNLTVHKKSEHHKLVHLKSKFTDLDSRKLLTFIKQLRSYDASGKTVYMCRNGATYSGLISVLCNLMDRLDNDMSCSIPIAVGLIKSVRPQAISTLEQYKLLFDILLRYTENSSVYGNVSLKTQKTP
ncbi:receptor-type tyrosine-protein phosphatase epsilon-like isoform X2 [Biomphalaria glabrata]|uniref:protein-tyrosine-phosphatase n=1 Tax=Biomphalaria glabrata TaxID=6526 RepID=A0A9W3ACB9_BIOGL|nr:receptor-type tyrosine-protein phosphatase epsilon-like isoform X2 [Biomphalaria glabrata]